MTGAGAASRVPEEGRSAPPCWHTRSVSLHALISPFRSSPPCPCLPMLGARPALGEASCLQVQARLAESEAWEGDLHLNPGCGPSSATVGAPQTPSLPSPISRGRGSQAFSVGSRQGLYTQT